MKDVIDQKVSLSFYKWKLRRPCVFSGDPENIEKSRQNAENKQTFDLSVEIEIEGKTRQNAENKQTFSISL